MQFLNNFYTVFVQVLILFIFMGFGFVGEKKKLISTEGSKVISDIILYFVTPCLIINSLNIKFDSDKLSGLLICLVAFFVIQIASVLLVCLLLKKDHISTRVLRFAVVFSNVGYMGLPLQKAVLGDEGVFYGSVCVAAFNVFVWTYGIICMSGDKKQMSVKKLILNPGIIAVTIGLILFFFSIKLPTPVSSAISGMAVLNTPLAMMVIGFNLARSNLLAALRDKLRIKMENAALLITSLSGGNQQKVVLSKWLAANPKVLVFDNPTQGVDVGAKEEIYDIIVQLAREGVGVVILSSEAQEIIRLCDRALVMYHGDVRAEVSGDSMNEHEMMRLATGG